MDQHQKQPYDTTLKALFNKQTEEMLAYILPEAQFVSELNSEVFKPQPPLRSDKIYLIFYRGELHILHIEIETKGKSSMPYRMLSYYALLLEQHKKPIISVIIYLFPAPVAEAPLQVTSGREIQLLYRYKPIALWTKNAQQYIDQQALCMYPLLPTMQGADAALLIQAIGELKVRYEGSELSHRLLWLRTLLGRAESIPKEDKEAVEKEIDMFDELLDEDPYLQERDALVALRESRDAVVEVVIARFPNLTDLARQCVLKVENRDSLHQLLRLIATSPDEAATKWLLSSPAA